MVREMSEPSSARRSPRTAVCTIVSNNYLPFARTLMGSLCETHPEWDRHVLITDEIRGHFNPKSEDFEVLEVEELPLPGGRRMLFQYSILELNTAVKPWWLAWLFERGDYDRVIYLDPDISVYRRLEEVERTLDAGNFMCLTPHLTGRLSEDRKPNETDILRAGTYNLGFIALSRHPHLEDFLAWWQSKMESDCVVDFDSGLFVDQKWIDLAPGMYPDVSILRHEGYNVAYWNLEHRRLEKLGDRFEVNGQPLVFFHFSGLDPLRPEAFSKHQDRFTLESLGKGQELALDYCQRVVDNGLEKCRKWPYAWAHFPDGAEIVDEVRALYREDIAVHEDGGTDPFELGAAYFNESIGAAWRGGPLVTRLMHHVWNTRLDLQLHFPDLDGSARRDFVNWFVNNAAVEHALPEAYIEPARRSLQADSGAGLRERMKQKLGAALQHLRPLARRLPPGMKNRLRRWLRAPARVPVSTIRPQLALGFGVDHVGFFRMDAHDLAHKTAWMGAKALVRLTESRGDTLRIAGEHRAEIHRLAHGSPRLTLRVSLDGRTVTDHTLQTEGPFEIEVEINQPVSRESVLGLEVSRAFVPSEIGLGEDPRELSLRMSRLELGDEAILDFARGDDCYVVRHQSKAMRSGFNIVGYVRSELGVGESARLCADAAEAAEIPFSMVDFSVGCSSRADDNRWAHRITQDNPQPINLIHVNADQIPVVYAHFGQPFFDHHYNIGFWHWELPELPDEWLGSFALLNEVWVPSHFVADAVSAKSPVPVVRMPHAVGFEPPRGARRGRFDLPEKKFLFLTMYDMHSVQARKNPEAVIEAFHRAFPDGADAGLVVKVMNRTSDAEPFARLEQRLREVPGVHLISETLDRKDVYALESVCDCFVSLHRSEGFGLGLAEAMYLGKPVIGTNWSANTDFMSQENSCPVRYTLTHIEKDEGPYRAGQIWAEPDIDHAAWYMKALVEDGEFRARLGAAGQLTIRSEYSPAAIGKRYRERLEILSRLI
jgi:glycosyltransferase involved in cell wall biosynthesis